MLGCLECTEILDIIDKIIQLIKQINSNDREEMLYVADVCKKIIFKWMQCITRHSQQNKAKIEMFEESSENKGLWLKDYAQKVLPALFREGQCRYFGKKGMSLHIDVFFLRNNNKLLKYVYFTVVYRCDQGVDSTLCISENVVKRFHFDHPSVSQLYTRSDNASSYHSNFVAEQLHGFCKDNQIKLLRYDYNKAQKGNLTRGYVTCWK